MQAINSHNYKLVYLSLFILSLTIVSFEIISTRISSVIFVYNYAFIILSFAILGLGCGGIYSFYKIKIKEKDNLNEIVFRILLYYTFSLAGFIILVILFSITNHFVFFVLLIIPFFFAGILYSVFFEYYSEIISRLYAADLIGAAFGAFIPIFLIKFFGATNSVLFLSLLMLLLSLLFKYNKSTKKIELIPFVALLILFVNGKNEFLGKVPIGNFPEKDFYYVYPDLNVKANIIDSRWSIFGRADLVQYSHQDIVRQLFIDGAAGTQMYRFNGDTKNPDRTLLRLLFSHSTTIPFLFLNENQKDSILIIGPGGGKEVLISLLSGIRKIIGVEINPDFVDIVKSHSKFNGGIYNNFSNVEIIVKEGRHYVKQSNKKFDIILMALPSTEQLQNIDALAMSENYLLTSEALYDYMNIMTNEGMLILTLHNKWELLRLIVTAVKTFERIGISNIDAVKHIIVLEDEYAPTVVIKKLPFTINEINDLKNKLKNFPKNFPQITFLPYDENVNVNNSFINEFLINLSNNNIDLKNFINNHPFDINPVVDDRPFFYKISKLLPDEIKWVLISILAINIALFFAAYSSFKREKNFIKIRRLRKILLLFALIGIGFMIIEISLFQKLILYVGSPTISLSILLFAVLTGMGLGSRFREKIFEIENYQRLKIICALIILYGFVVFFFGQYLFRYLLLFNQYFVITMMILLILPLGVLLGFLFPSLISLLKKNNLDKYIPWMYGINAVTSVLGSVAAYSLSMLTGFTVAFVFGLLFYFVFAVLVNSKRTLLL
ncbi:hypothetical protein VJY32_10140 [Ignavibacteria bacterium 4148-Me]|uniref:hypothetical protein n=1 Tax=Rosettibacter primus TaxID=3111523 RepID=UPI00336C1DC7